MNKYLFSEISVGLVEKFTVVIDEEKMRYFEALSGDKNPLHTNEEFAKERGFDHRVVYGMLVSSFYSTLVGIYLPGENALLQDISIRFHGIASIGDYLTVSGKVEAVDQRFKRIKIKALVRNNREKLVSTAIINVGFTDEN